jgi:formate hydrogenlyase subunit 3/multisubunit Na+/H+ antiporter MnhD subunit
MYLSLLALPLLGAITSGLLGRKLGVTGAQLITCACMITAALLSIVAFYEVALCGSPVSIHLSSWIDTGMMSVDWAFMFDSLTVSMLLPVLVVSSMVHVYSISYMSADPHNQRFFSYLSMFTFFMLILVAGDNYLILFVGWEGIGVSSYLLINFWFTRIQANKSAIKAMVVNRVGDMFLSVAFFGVFWTFGNLDYATVYSLSPYINETVLTVIGLFFLLAAMGKSAQLGLHTWLPDAMEGLWNWFKGLTSSYLSILVPIVFVVSLILLDEEPSNIHMASIPGIITSLPRATLETITGNLLGDGGIQYSNFKRDGKVSGNARYGMTMAAAVFNYMNDLFNSTYAQFSTLTGLTPYPNIDLRQYEGQSVTQYHFDTRSLPLFTALHSI